MRRTLLFSSTLVLLMGAGVAYAGSSNTLYIDQSGDGNTANVDQSNGPGGNDIGTPGDPVNQTGNNNSFNFSNAGCCNTNNRYNNDVNKAEQVGDNNWLNIHVWNLAHDNVVSDAQQLGNTNRLLIEQNGSNYGTVGTILQDGDVNSAYIGQGGSNNTVSNVEMVGSNNGYSNTMSMASGRFDSLRIRQGGSGNLVNHARIEGDNNKQIPSNGYAPLLDIYQSGSNNGLTSSVATMLGSNGNGIKVTEIGDWNNFSVMQGTSTASTGNYATVTQTGSYNDATVTQFGSYNQLVVTQLDDGNSSTTNFTGDSNGVGTLTGVAGGLTNVNLVEGSVYQNSTGAGSGNSLTYNVTGSNNLAISQ